MLDGLADEAEGVRDAALAAGRTLVELYATTSLPLLLPAVEAGIVDANWRIRHSSVELLGDLLFKVCGGGGGMVWLSGTLVGKKMVDDGPEHHSMHSTP